VRATHRERGPWSESHVTMKNKRPPWRNADHESIHLARKLRHAATPAEAILWERLRDRKLAGLKFRRQHIYQGFVLDFYNAEHCLAIELDGAVHATQADYDQQRTETLNGWGVKVLRFTNGEVERDLDGVLKKIVEACRRPALTPDLPLRYAQGQVSPSPVKRERGLGVRATPNQSSPESLPPPAPASADKPEQLESID